MFISRVEIDSNNRRKIKNLNHLGAYHNWVEQSFPTEVNAGTRARHLWRVDSLNGHDYLIIVSSERPDLTLLSQFGIEGTADTKDYDRFLEGLSKDSVYSFRLTANPSYTARDANDKPHVYPHVTAEQQLNWFLKKAEKHGFEFLKNSEEMAQAQVTERGYAILNKSGRRLRLSRVSFEGLLRITDIELMKKTLVEGIGREKAYGMGLLTLIEVSGR